MLVFQVNPNQLKEGQELQGKDWLFWNAYLAERVEKDDYVLLPDYIDFITDTDNNADEGHYLVEIEDDGNEVLDN